MGRISISWVLGFVAVVAIGLAALVRATMIWAGATFTLMMVLLLGSLVGLILRGWRGGSWLGFAVFGWGFFVFGSLPVSVLGYYPTHLSDTFSQWVFEKSNVLPARPADLSARDPTTGDYTPEVNAFVQADFDYRERNPHALMIGRWLWVLLFASLGAIFGVFLARPRRTDGVVPADPQSPVG